jgi:O-antigen/teichoic acid export membrane protein
MTVLSRTTRQNVFYSLLDYISQPALMLIAAPLLLRALGVQQYGTWMLVNSVAAAASGLGGGFGEGATKYVSMYRGCGDNAGALRSTMAVLVLNCGFGLLSAVAMAAAAPWLIGHLFKVPADLQHAGIVALRISAFLLLARFAESVFTSAVRGCERYRPIVIISVLARSSVTLSTLGLALKGYGLIGILWATLGIGLVSLVGQAWLAYSVLQADGVWWQTNILAGICEIFSFGVYTWLKATLGVLIGYADRLLVAGLLGTGPLAYYALCNQLTQPLPALMAAAFNFVFPNFSALTASGRWSDTRRGYRLATAFATLLVFAISITLILGARFILRCWLGSIIATQYHDLLVAMAIGNGLLALSVVPQYAALALGRSRALAIVNLAAGALTLGAGYLLIHRMGLVGAGFAKIVAGTVFLSVFGIVRRALRKDERKPVRRALDAPTSTGFDFAH